LKVLFFAPHSATWIHAFPEALVAEALAKLGDEIVYVGCGRTLRSHCVAMSSYSVPFSATAEQKSRICALCEKNLAIIRGRFGFAGPDLSALVTDDDLSAAEQMLGSTPPENYVNLVLDGVEVGRIALYEMLIQTKRATLEFNGEERARHRASLKNVIVVLRTMRRLLDDLRPDRIVLYNALYSVNRAVCRLAELRGIPQYFLHAGENLSNRLETLVFAKDHAFSYYRRLRDEWPRFEHRPCPPQAMRAATDHLLEVAKGRSAWAYSAASGNRADLRKSFGIRDGQRVICATMSSDDERFGAEIVGVLPPTEGLLFAKQVDWIRALVDYVEGRPELFLVIRVHPREFPNKREGVLSDHARLLKEAFAKLPANAKVNWPTENVSLYDLAAITDVFANGWSSAGKEMSLLGLPVVLYSAQFVLYPPSLNYVGTTKAAYFAQIERALADGWDIERTRKTFRWNAVDYHYASLDISDSFSRDEHAPFLAKAMRRVIRAIAPTLQQESDCRRRSKNLSAGGRMGEVLHGQLVSVVDLELPASAVSLAEETECLKREVGRLVDGLFGPGGDPRTNPLAAKLRGFAGS
jgi:hypothetical protein